MQENMGNLFTARKILSGTLIMCQLKLFSISTSHNNRPHPFCKLVERSEPDIAHGDLAWLTFDFKADETGLVIDGVHVVVNEDGHQLAVHDMHHDSAARDDLVFIPFVNLYIAAKGVLVADRGDKTIGLVGERLCHLAAISKNALHGVLGVPLAGVGCSLRADREPEVGLRARHHKLQVVRWQSGGLRPCPRYTGDAAVLNSPTASFFDL